MNEVTNDQDSKATPASFLHIQPKRGDILVVRTSTTLSRLKAERLRRTIGDALSGTGVYVLILPDTMGVDLIRQEDAPDCGLDLTGIKRA